MLYPDLSVFAVQIACAFSHLSLISSSWPFLCRKKKHTPELLEQLKSTDIKIIWFDGEMCCRFSRRMPKYQNVVLAFDGAAKLLVALSNMRQAMCCRFSNQVVKPILRAVKKNTK